MGLVGWIRGFGARRRAQVAEEERSPSKHDRAASESMRTARLAGHGDPRHDPSYVDPTR